MNFFDLMCLAIVVVVTAKTIAWLIQLRTHNAAVVDPIWAWSLGSLAVLFGVAGSAPPEVRMLVALMGGVWGMRLGMHLWTRMADKLEDFRYARFRADWGDKANRNLFFFFQFQNLFTLILAASAFGAASYRDDSVPMVLMVLAVLIWFVAVVGEGLADAQMDRFRRDPGNQGEVCRDGLWRYSRHPNYFFECVHWLAYVPLAWGAPWAWTVAIAPLVMAFLLTRLSGMPMLEAEMAKRKLGFTEYVRTTSPLIPWFPKQES